MLPSLPAGEAREEHGGGLRGEFAGLRVGLGGCRVGLRHGGEPGGREARASGLGLGSASAWAPALARGERLHCTNAQAAPGYCERRAGSQWTLCALVNG